MKAIGTADFSLENRVELKRICNLLRRAGGFALAFASVADCGSGSPRRSEANYRIPRS
jgi:hypothetical protein